MKPLISPKREECHTSGLDYLKPEKACTYQVEPATWAVMGNSHAVELAYELSKDLKQHGLGVRHFTFSGCPPAFGRTDEHPPGCAAWTDEVVSFLIRTKEIKVVVLSYRTTRELGHVNLSVQNKMESIRTESYIKTIHALANSGKKVFVVLQAPQITTHVERIVQSHSGDFSFVPGVSRSLWLISSSPLRSKLSDLPTSAIVIDPVDSFCKKEYCAAVKNGKALYFDDHHISLSGAAIISGQIMEHVFGRRK